MNIEFNFRGSKLLIPSEKEDKFIIACQHFCTKANTNLTNLKFLYQGKVLKDEMEEKIENMASDIDIERNNIIIIVNEDETPKHKKEIIKSNNVICPECGEISEIKIEDYRFTIFGCSNNHNTSNLTFEKLEENQLIDISKILCDNCKLQTKSEVYNKIFYRCNICKMNLCPLCKLKHNETQKDHNVIKYDEKDFICSEHNKKFTCYCKNCNMNLCSDCLGGHQKNDIISYVNIINDKELNIDALKVNLEKIKKNIIEIKNKWEQFSVKFKQNMDFFQKFYKFYENILKNYNSKNQNFVLLNNINYLKDNNITRDINNLVKLNDFEFFTQIMNINYNINTPNINEMIINYKIDKNEPKIKLFSKSFVNDNQDKCHLIINGNKTELIDQYEINNFNDSILTIKLVGLRNITNISSMFRNCTSLLTIPNLSEINTFRFTSFNQMFYGCTSLENLPDISNWNTINVEDFSYMFGYCSKLETIPDISKWNTMKATDFTGMFYQCSSLKAMPDISIWNTSRVTCISYLFSGCTSLDLKEIKGISKWDTSSLIYATHMIKGCPGILDDQSNFELRKTFGNFLNIFF